MNCEHLPQVMVNMAQNRSLTEVLHSIADGVAQCKNVVLARIWLIKPSTFVRAVTFAPSAPTRRAACTSSQAREIPKIQRRTIVGSTACSADFRLACEK